MIRVKRPSRLVRLAISVGLLALLFFMIDWKGALAEAASVPSELAAAAMAIFAFQFVVSSWKWRASLLAHGVDIPFRFLLRTYCIGAYLSSFLPSNLGGDIYRTFRTSTYCSVPVAMFAVILERVVGLVALVVVGALGALWLLLIHQWLSASSFALAAVTIVGGYFFAPFFLLDVLRRSGASQRWIPKRFNPDAMDLFSFSKPRLLELLAACFVFQVIATLAVALLFIAVGAPWLPAESALANAAGSIAATLPVSINGLGVTEASFAGVASRVGVDFTTAAMVSLLVRILVLPLVLAFGVLYMLEGDVKAGNVALTMDTEKLA